MRKRSAAFIIQNQKILLFERHKNGLHYYAIPGGTVEKGESLEDALNREMLEETSLEIEINELVFKSVSPEYGECAYFTLKSFEGTPQMDPNSPESLRNNPSNHYELKWVDLKDLPKLNLLPSSAKDYLINKYLNNPI